jgi:hypothetical protein
MKKLSILLAATCCLAGTAFAANQPKTFDFPFTKINFTLGVSNFHYYANAQTASGPVKLDGKEPNSLIGAVIAVFKSQLNGQTLVGNNNTIAFYNEALAKAPTSCVIDLNTAPKNAILNVGVSSCQVISK